jgi:hypothetical protein
MASLFVLCYFCDEGLNRFDEVFQAESKEDVLTYMLKEIKSYVRWLKKYQSTENNIIEMPTKFKNGASYYRMLRSAEWNPRVNNKNIGFDLKYTNQKEKVDAEQRFLLKASIHDIQTIIDNSYVDGDSSFQILLLPIQVTVDLIK